MSKYDHSYTFSTIITFMQEDTTLYGVDWNGPLPDAEEVDQVDVTETMNPLQEHDYLQLQDMVSPISESDCFGVDLFLRVLEFVCQKLN